MTDWPIFLIIFGGFAAVLFVGFSLMARWLLRKITAALESYMTAFAQESAKVDARIEHLAKLAEEQARLTRAGENINDEIAAQAKGRDNQWEFRKNVYVQLVKSANSLRNKYLAIAALQPDADLGNYKSANAARVLQPQLHGLVPTMSEFHFYSDLAPLALADDIAPLVDRTLEIVREKWDHASMNIYDMAIRKAQAVSQLITGLKVAGRRDLWSNAQK